MMTSWLALFSVPCPRIRNVAPSPPGLPLPWFTYKPDANPAKPAESDVIGRPSACSAMLMDETEPVRFSFFWVPNPTTTTSLRLLTDGRSEMISVFCVPMRSEEHTSELQSLMRISYAVFCLKQKKKE